MTVDLVTEIRILDFPYTKHKCQPQNDDVHFEYICLYFDRFKVGSTYLMHVKGTKPCGIGIIS